MALRDDQGYRMTFDLSQAKIYIRPGPTDMRKQINGLSVIVESVMGFSPFSGNLFLFCGKTKAVLKVLYWDRNGFVLTQKRLEKDRFPWPKDAAQAREIDREQVLLLLRGIDIWREHRPISYTSVL